MFLSKFHLQQKNLLQQQIKYSGYTVNFFMRLQQNTFLLQSHEKVCSVATVLICCCNKFFWCKWNLLKNVVSPPSAKNFWSTFFYYPIKFLYFCWHKQNKSFMTFSNMATRFIRRQWFCSQTHQLQDIFKKCNTFLPYWCTHVNEVSPWNWLL